MLGSSFPDSDVWVAHDQRASGWHDDHPSLLCRARSSAKFLRLGLSPSVKGFFFFFQKNQLG